MSNEIEKLIEAEVRSYICGLNAVSIQSLASHKVIGVSVTDGLSVHGVFDWRSDPQESDFHLDCDIGFNEDTWNEDLNDWLGNNNITDVNLDMLDPAFDEQEQIEERFFASSAVIEALREQLLFNALFSIESALETYSNKQLDYIVVDAVDDDLMSYRT
jgi:hypothetical protein